MSPNATHIEEEGVYIDKFKLVEARAFPRGGAARAADRRALSRAQSGAEHRRPEGAGRRQREGRAELAQDGRALRARRRAAPIWATCRTMRPKACAASSTRSETASSARDWTRATSSRSRSRSTRRSATREVDFTGTSAAAARTISTRPSRSRARRCSMCSACMVDDDIPMNAGCLRPIEDRRARRARC